MGVSTKQQFTDKLSGLSLTARLRSGALVQQIAPLAGLGAGAWAIAQLSLQLANSLVLPTFTAHIYQAKTDDALMQISAINQAQQVHFLDHNRFAGDLAALELGLLTQTPYYDYQLQPALPSRMRSSPRQTKQAATPAAPGEPQTPPPDLTVSLALPNQPGLPAYWGAVQGAADGTIAESLVCRSLPENKELAGLAPRQRLMRRLRGRSRRPLPPPPPRSLACPPGYTPLNF